MRIYSFLLLLVCTLLLVPVRSHAGFLVKHSKHTAVVSVHNAIEAAVPDAANTAAPAPHECNGCEDKRREERRNGWAGTASMWVAIGGAIYMFFPPFMILAAIFAAIGLKPGKPKRGRAIAGLIISVFGLMLWGFLIAIGLW
ncbi:hypothetical protein GCM10023093_27320 [Nemorincola caseinilytica]|uniref:DUF4190 domain-containing protein n=1 Tax=Nemorincola caseinilytica TaxID=2054315 RepID=A0ABP8NNR3_9BACT